MANKDLHRHAHGPRDESWWWYEEPRGLTIVVPAHEGLCAKVIKIPWRSIRASLARKDKPSVAARKQN